AITVPRATSPTLRGVAVHRCDLAKADRAVVDGIPVTAAARTIVDLASCVSRSATEAALEDALTRRLLTTSYLARRLEAIGRQGRKGAGVVASLLAERPEHWVKAESRFERRLLLVLRDFGLPRPQLQ